MRKAGVPFAGLVVLWMALCNPRLLGQTPALSINPMRIETAGNPGTEKTVSFEIGAPASSKEELGRLLVSLTDWTINEDGSVAYGEPGTQVNSASPWVAFSPAALTIRSGQKQLVRITVKIPEKTEPGVYRTALFIQGRPQAAPPKNDGATIFLHLRFAFTLYVIVPPVSPRPDLTNVELDTRPSQVRLTCTLKNSGSAHVRPLVRWTIKRPTGDVVSQGSHDATVLLPFSTLREPVILRQTLEPGSYEVSVVVDFRDGQALQAMTRPFDVAAPKPF